MGFRRYRERRVVREDERCVVCYNPSSSVSHLNSSFSLYK